nr:cytosolic sulfotransferase 17-like [Ipomoea batatas]
MPAIEQSFQSSVPVQEPETQNEEHIEIEEQIGTEEIERSLKLLQWLKLLQMNLQALNLILRRRQRGKRALHHLLWLMRNPKDTLNSLWHFANKWKMAEEAPWELEEAVEKFLRGTVLSGPYYEHVLGYRMASLKNPSKFFFITYEELKDDTKTHVKRLAEFLGCPFAGSEEDKEVEEIVKCCSFEVLKNHEVNKSENCPD